MARFTSKNNKKAGRKFTRRFSKRLLRDSEGECSSVTYSWLRRSSL